MATSWGFGNLPAPAGGGSNGQIVQEADLEAIDVEQVGFKPLASDSKVRLLPTPWPKEQYPITTSSLLSIASGRGLLAAAGPDVLVLASTQRVRQTFIPMQPKRRAEGEEVDPEELKREKAEIAKEPKIKDFTPEVTLQIPRVSQVAFSSDESCLVISAEEGGGLAVYDVEALLKGSKDPAFQMATNGTAVRHLLPNPAKESSHLFAIVLANGTLVLADLKQRQLVSGASGSSVFKDDVSCACWSKLGKQIVAGFSSGAAAQIDLKGNVKAEIPRPPQLDNGRDKSTISLPMTTIYWLETFDVLTIHTPINPPPDQVEDAPPPNDSITHIIHRDKLSGSSTYRKFNLDPFAGFLDERVPAHHFIQRLREWSPNLDDALIISSTLSSDVGLITKSSVSFHLAETQLKDGKIELIGEDIPQDRIINTYTTTIPKLDESRATLPVSTIDDGADTSVIGMALDLSTTEKVWWPLLPDKEVEESATPLPAVCILNHEGILSSWHFIYKQSIREGTAYPGLTAGSGQQQQSQFAQPQPRPQASNGFGGNSTPTPALTKAPARPVQPPHGPSSTPAFGGNAALGQAKSPWGAPPASPGPKASAFGQPSGGATAFGAPSGFGQSGGIGPKQSVWGTPSQTPPNQKPASSAFGQASGPFGGNGNLQSPFASFGKPSGGDSNKPSASPFSSFASGGGSNFGSFSQNSNRPPASPFAAAGQQKPGMPFDPSFGSTVTLNSTTGSFGSGGTFGQSSTFGQTSFGKPTQAPKEETMDDSQATSKPAEEKQQPSALGGFKLGSTFSGDGSAKDDLPKPKDAGSSLFGTGFGSALGDAGKKDEKKEAPKSLSGGSSGFNAGGSGYFGKRAEPTTPIKPEPGTDEQKLSDIPAFSTTPASPPKQPKPQPEEAPMPPDFLSAKPKKEDSPPPPIPDDAPLPPDFTTQSRNADDGTDVPIAGSPPLDVGNEKFSEPASSIGEGEGPPEDDDEVDWSDEEGEESGEAQESDDEDEEDGSQELGFDEDDEGDDDEDDEADSHAVGDAKGLSAFEARLAPASPKRNQPSQDSTTPETLKKPSYTPAGLPPNLTFPPPVRPQESPSPVRAASSPMRFGQATKPPPPVPALQFEKISVPPAQPVERPTSRQKSSTPQPAPKQIDLEDEEDARIKAILDASIEPNKDVPEFIAHRDYTGGTEKPGIAGQMEKVYRDVNSMVDTLGLNARALQAFVDGHKRVRDASSPRTRDDLEDEEAWVFEESDELRSLIKGIDNGLENGRVEDPAGKIEDLQDEDKELVQLMAKTAEFRKQIASHADPEQRATQFSAPLPPETQAQQSELRQSVTKVQKLLAQAEEAMGLLRADLASLPSAGQQDGASNVPTVEAVTNTILKMTAMVEKRSGDVDVLESQIRRLPGGLAALRLQDNYEDDLVKTLRGSKLIAGANGSPYTTPPASRGRMAANGDPLGMSGMLGGSRFLRSTPGRAVTELSASVLGRSTASMGSARKRMQDVTSEEVDTWRKKDGRRKRVLGGLRERVEDRGARTVRAEKV